MRLRANLARDEGTAPARCLPEDARALVEIDRTAHLAAGPPAHVALRATDIVPAAQAYKMRMIGRGFDAAYSRRVKARSHEGIRGAYSVTGDGAAYGRPHALYGTTDNHGVQGSMVKVA